MNSTIAAPPGSENELTVNLSFDQPGLLSALCAASTAEYDQAGFGIVAMGLDSVVKYYNLWESKLSGLRPADVVGRNFFADVAPCTNNFMVALRYEAADLDETVDYVFSYRVRPVGVRLRLLKSTEKAQQFLVVERAVKP